MLARRRLWFEGQAGLAPERLIFIDERSTPGVAENGGFISTTVGWTSWSRSAMASALKAVVTACGNRWVRRRARAAAYSLRWRLPAAWAPIAHSAMTASMPVPAEGSSTVSPGRMAAAWSAA